MTDLEQRKIIVLRSEGKSYNAIADEMNLSQHRQNLLPQEPSGRLKRDRKRI